MHPSWVRYPREKNPNMIHCSIFQIILENNGRVDVFDHEGRSALHLAAEFGSIEVCEALLNKNAFINSKAKTGML